MKRVDTVRARLRGRDGEAALAGKVRWAGSAAAAVPIPGGRPLARSGRKGGLLLGLAALLLTASAGVRAEPSRSPAVAKPAASGRAARGPLGRARRPLTDQDILDQAQAAYIRGERQHAIDLATGIAEKGGELAGPAWRFIGLVACSVRAYRLATRAFGNILAQDDQEALILACKSNGLAFRNREFVER